MDKINHTPCWAKRAQTYSMVVGFDGQMLLYHNFFLNVALK